MRKQLLMSVALLIAAQRPAIGQDGAGLALDSNNKWVVTVQTANLSPAERDLLAVDASWAKAYQTCDLKLMDRVLSDDLLFIHNHGHVDRKPAMMAEFSKCQNETALTEPIKITLRGDTAIVVGNMKLTSKGGTTLTQILYTRIYARANDTWKMISHQSTTNWLQNNRLKSN